MDFEYNPDNIDDYDGFDPIGNTNDAPQEDAFGFIGGPANTDNTQENPDDLFGLGMNSTPQPTPTAKPTPTAQQPEAPAQVSAKKEWDMKKQQELKAKAEQQRAQFKQNQEEGKKELAKFQQDRTTKIAQKKQANRGEEQQGKQEQQSAQQSSNQWVKVSSYCNLKQPDPKKAHEQNNSERMRTLLIDLKNNNPQ